MTSYQDDPEVQNWLATERYEYSKYRSGCFEFYTDKPYYVPFAIWADIQHYTLNRPRVLCQGLPDGVWVTWNQPSDWPDTQIPRPLYRQKEVHSWLQQKAEDYRKSYPDYYMLPAYERWDGEKWRSTLDEPWETYIKDPSDLRKEKRERDKRQAEIRSIALNPSKKRVSKRQKELDLLDRIEDEDIEFLKEEAAVHSAEDHVPEDWQLSCELLRRMVLSESGDDAIE